MPEINLAGVKALIADDNATNRLILKEALTSWGALVTEVSGGESAVLELQRDHATEPYQLVLLDCHMADLSGFDVIQKFMSTSTLDGMTVMILTSDSRSADIAKSYKLGLGGVSRQADSAIGLAQGHYDCGEPAQRTGVGRAPRRHYQAGGRRPQDSLSRRFG
jgi:CheY-like chemotaxis protein